MKSIKNTAKKYIEAGLSVIPVNDKKAPVNLSSWTPYQTRRASDDEIKKLFTGAGVFGIAVIGGEISGGLEVLDFDSGGAVYPGWKEKIPPELFQKLTVEKSPHGIHVYFRSNAVEGNAKLANAENNSVLIETRGRGGYCICAPTPGYSLIQGSMLEIQTITPAERETLIEAAREFNQVKKQRPKKTAPKKTAPKKEYRGQDFSPADYVSENGDIRAILERNGWKFERLAPDGNERWRRPGKDDGHGGTLKENENGVLLFYPFTTSTKFTANQGYNAFQVLSILEYNGDESEAARAIWKEINQERRAAQTSQTDAQPAPASDGSSAHAGDSKRAQKSQKQRGEGSQVPLAYDGYGNIIYGNMPAPAPEAVDDGKPFLPIIRRAKQIPDKPINFLWKDRFSYQFGLIAGRQGLGKSMFVCYIAAQITTASVKSWGDGAQCPTGCVMFFTPEGGESLTIQRIRNMGGNTDNLVFYSGTGKHLRPDNKTIDTDIDPVVSDTASLTQAIDAAEQETGQKVHLIIIDPISDFMGDIKQNDNAEVTQALRGLDYLAVEKSICIIGVKHLNKNANTSAAVYNVGGSNAFTSKPRFVYLLDQTPESRKAELMGDSSTEKSLLLVPAKCNDFIIKNSIEFILSGGEENFHVEITDLSGDWTGDALQYELTLINGGAAKGRGRPANDERNAKIKEMILNGASDEEIIQETGASKSTIYREKKGIEADIIAENLLSMGGDDEQEEKPS